MIKELDIDLQEWKALSDASQPTIALLHYYELIDDFLDKINISLETFCKEFVGSWMFGYVNALNQVGVRTVLFCISDRVERPTRFIHQPTGARICVLPPPQIYRAFRAIQPKSLLDRASQASSFKDVPDRNSLRRSLLLGLRDLARSLKTYRSTPLGLLARELQREKCQAILCQEYEYARFDTCVALGKTIRLPVFATFQGGDKSQSLLEIPLRQLSIRACTGLIIATQSEIQRVHTDYGIPSKKIAHIFNPLDVAKWQVLDRVQARAALGISLDARVVAWHGRIEIERKGLDILLEAWQQICYDRPDKDLRLLIVGTGSDADLFRQRIDEMQLKGVMWLNEFVSDRTVIQTHLCAADVYAFPSRQEGFPIAPIEAMACGLPVVAADAPGIPDIFAEGEISGGIIVPRGEKNAFASALGQLLDRQTWCRELGTRSRHRAETCFSPKIIGQQLKNFLLK